MLPRPIKDVWNTGKRSFNMQIPAILSDVLCVCINYTIWDAFKIAQPIVSTWGRSQIWKLSASMMNEQWVIVCWLKLLSAFAVRQVFMAILQTTLCDQWRLLDYLKRESMSWTSRVRSYKRIGEKLKPISSNVLDRFEDKEKVLPKKAKLDNEEMILPKLDLSSASNFTFNFNFKFFLYLHINYSLGH